MSEIDSLGVLEAQLYEATCRVQRQLDAGDRDGLREEFQRVKDLKEQLRRFKESRRFSARPTVSSRGASANLKDASDKGVASSQNYGAEAMEELHNDREAEADPCMYAASALTQQLDGRPPSAQGCSFRHSSVLYNPKFGFCWMPDFLIVRFEPEELLYADVESHSFVLAYALVEGTELKTPIMQTPPAQVDSVTREQTFVFSLDVLRVFKQQVLLTDTSRLLVEVRIQPSLPLNTGPDNTKALGWLTVPVFSNDGRIYEGNYCSSFSPPPINLTRCFSEPARLVGKANYSLYYRLRAIREHLTNDFTDVADFAKEGGTYAPLECLGL